MKDKFVVAQLGARMHYAIPKIFAKENQLAGFYTDAYYLQNNFCLKKIQQFFPIVRKYDAEIKPEIVSCFWGSAILSRLYHKSRFASRGLLNSQLIAFQTRMLRNAILSDSQEIAFHGIYGFDTASKEIFEYFRNKKKLVLEQCVAPRSTQLKLKKKFALRGETKNFVKKADSFYKKLHERELIEWDLADIILCPSQFVKNELVKCKVDETKIRVVPYGYTNPVAESSIVENLIDRLKPNKKIVLYVGNASLRKGLYDVIQVAKKLPNYSFHIVGNVGINLDEIILPSNVILKGKLSQKKLIKEYKEASVFFLPSYLEGSATVIYEALSWGLPVVTTPNAGSVVKDGKEGFIHLPQSIRQFCTSIQNICINRELAEKLSYAAYQKAQQYTRIKYGERLLEVVNN